MGISSSSQHTRYGLHSALRFPSKTLTVRTKFGKTGKRWFQTTPSAPMAKPATLIAQFSNPTRLVRNAIQPEFIEERPLAEQVISVPTRFTKYTAGAHPMGTVGRIVHSRTYGRAKYPDQPRGPKESWAETVTRVVLSCNQQLKVNFTPEEQEKWFQMLYNLECCVGGRFLWQLGTKTVDTFGLASLQNCAATLVNQPIRPFVWTMDMLMAGSGVGYNLSWEHVRHIPKVLRVKVSRLDTKDADFIVPDTREGWGKLLHELLDAHFNTGRSFTYSCQLLREKGQPIRSFGGTASGPGELADGIQAINGILNSRAGRKLRPIDALDIMTLIGRIVVSGNVRRSAQLAAGDLHDHEFLMAKRWDLTDRTIPNNRQYSNNSILCDDINEVLSNDDFWAGYNGNGEAYGLLNMKLVRSCGRTGDFEHPDPDAIGFNPCAEQPLADKETCCLGELFLPNIKSEAHLLECAIMLYRVLKHSLALPCHHPETEKIVHANMRMGIGVTGYLQATEEQRRWLPNVYRKLREFDRVYSKKHGFPESIKLTTVKPSGTLSLLPNVTPGCHPGFAPFTKRLIRFDASLYLLKALARKGHKVEYVRNQDKTLDLTTKIAEFALKLPPGTPVATQWSAIQQLEVVKRLQREWSDNAVSCTVYYKLEELPAIKDWLRQNYNHSIKSISFMLHTGHGYEHAPITEITEREYNEMVANQQVLTDEDLQPPEDISNMSQSVNEHEESLLQQTECATGACPVR